MNKNESIFGPQGKFDVKKNDKTSIKIQMAPEAILVSRGNTSMKVFKQIEYLDLKRLESYREETVFFGDNMYLAMHLKDGGVFVICSPQAGKIKDEIQTNYKRVKQEHDDAVTQEASEATKE